MMENSHHVSPLLQAEHPITSTMSCRLCLALYDLGCFSFCVLHLSMSIFESGNHSFIK